MLCHRNDVSYSTVCYLGENYNNMARLRGIIPKLAELFRFVNYYNLPKCYSYVLVMLYLIIYSY